MSDYKKNVLCFGSLNIDYTYEVDRFVAKGETLNSRNMHRYEGGKGLNQAVALAKAGLDIHMAGAIGTDGCFLIQYLSDLGIQTDNIRILDDIATGHAIIQNDKTGDNCILLFGGANRAITTDWIDHVLSQFHAGDLLVLQNEISHLPYIIEEAHARGMKICFNPSPMEAAIMHYPLDQIDYFIMNEVETRQLSDLLGISSIQSFREQYPQANLVITYGENGSEYFGANLGKNIQVPAKKVTPVDTTGAGDTFTGYLIAGIYEEMDMKTSMEMATQAAALAIQRKGAAPGIPFRKEVENHTIETDTQTS